MQRLKNNLKELFKTLESIRKEYRMSVLDLASMLNLSRDSVDNIRTGIRDGKVKIELKSVLLLQYATYNHHWYKKLNGDTKKYTIPINPDNKLRLSVQEAIELRKKKVSREEMRDIFQATTIYRFVRWEKDWLEGRHQPRYDTAYLYCNHLGIKELVYTHADVEEVLKRIRYADRHKQDVDPVI